MQRVCWRLVASLRASSSWKLSTAARSLSSQPAPPSSGFVVPSSAVDELLQSRPEVLNSLGEPTFASLGLGEGFWPSSLALKLMELLHVDCGASWWLCAFVMGAGVRCALLYPTLLSRKAQVLSDSAEVARLTELSRKYKSAQALNNVAEMRQLVEQLSSSELQPARVKSSAALRYGATALGLNLAGIFVLHLACIRAIYAATAVPVASMEWGGTAWLLDLTCADPTALMPACVTAVMLLNILQFYRIAPGNQLLQAAMPLALTMAPMLFFTFLLNCPGALQYYFLSTGLCALAVNLVAKR